MSHAHRHIYLGEGNDDATLVDAEPSASSCRHWASTRRLGDVVAKCRRGRVRRHSKVFRSVHHVAFVYIKLSISCPTITNLVKS